jgi:hypothetical protein
VLVRIFESKLIADSDQLANLLTFMTFQWIRGPAFRPITLAIAESVSRRHLLNLLKTPESWNTALKRVGMPADTPGADYNGMKAFLESGNYSVSANPEWFLEKGFNAVDPIFSALFARLWSTAFSPSGSFIASDNPVMLDGPKDQPIGFTNADVVIFPVNRYILLVGTNTPVQREPVTRNLIARHNTFTMLTAHEQIFSTTPDFCWLDETGKYQTDWRRFSKDTFFC